MNLFKSLFRPQEHIQLAVDCIIQTKNNKIILIERKNPPYGWALPGGKVNYGESAENACHREMYEETNTVLQNLQQFKVFSDPERDSRGHFVSVVFTATTESEPRAADDAKSLRLVDISEIPWETLVFDHARILHEWLVSKEDRRDWKLVVFSYSDRNHLNMFKTNLLFPGSTFDEIDNFFYSANNVKYLLKTKFYVDTWNQVILEIQKYEPEFAISEKLLVYDKSDYSDYTSEYIKIAGKLRFYNIKMTNYLQSLPVAQKEKRKYYSTLISEDSDFLKIVTKNYTNIDIEEIETKYEKEYQNRLTNLNNKSSQYLQLCDYIEQHQNDLTFEEKQNLLQKLNYELQECQDEWQKVVDFCIKPA